MLIRLKSLEMHGYKTFADQTRFEFPGNDHCHCGTQWIRQIQYRRCFALGVG